MYEYHAAQKNRWRWMKVVVVVAFIALLFRLFTMQITKGPEYQAKIESKGSERFVIMAPRGKVIGRNGNILADTKPELNLVYIPLEAEAHLKPQDISKILAPQLGVRQEELLAVMDAGDTPHLPLSYPRRIFSNLNQRQFTFLHEHQDTLPGVHVIVESKRNYPNRHLAPHILGYLNSIPADEWEKYSAHGYPLDAQVGVYGIEKQYESYLKGTNGTLIVGSGNHPTGQFSVRTLPSLPGHDIVLNLDPRIQEVAENALKEQIQTNNADPKKHKLEHASAVVMIPMTGEILAMASYPGFDPAIWVGGISRQAYRAFEPAQQNWALQVPVSPGSTVKPLTLLIGLEKGIVSPKQSIHDPGRFQVGWKTNGDPHYFYCWDHGGHGKVDARKALAVSCNVYMYQLSLELGNYSIHKNATAWLKEELPQAMLSFHKYHQQFGLGVRTGIDLPEEVNGRFFDSGQLADLPFAAIGQNQAYTTMQLVQYVSVLANGGKRMEPHIVKEVKTSGGQVIKQNVPKVMNEIIIPPDILQVIREGMRDVIAKPYGTAYKPFQGVSYSVAGKTGTSETGRGEDNSLFIGYAPYEKPEIAIAVVVPEGGHGSDSSTPIARKILDVYFQEGIRP